MYIRRHLDITVRRAAKLFPALIVTGARQTGKTTLLRNAYAEVPYITMDDPVLLRSAIETPAQFFVQNPPPVILDEIQYTPALFPYIKMMADEKRQSGLFFLSGSQQFTLMQNVSETLAGRIGVLNLLGLSRREIQNSDFNTPFLPVQSYFDSCRSTASPLANVWETIHRGSFPAMHNPDADWELFYASYVKTYIERDVHQLTNIGDELTFLKFLTAVAANTGNLLNYASLARDIGISQPTAERWISVLATSNIIYLLKPYANNILKRALKTPKVYFLDTGLAAYLTRWITPEALEHGAAAGAFFETYVITEIIKSYTNKGKEPPLYFFRDKEQNEIDVVIHQNGVLHPIEIKKHADPKPADTKVFRFLDDIPGQTRGSGGVISLYPRFVPLSPTDVTIPLWYV